eukprot:CAMPEP_0183720586 /NCGR_PEP_ID=MMETSP0737-20130205/13154_1 /TAXON_ID=385413 /ORGANISM="Thalassiosira miniscula, Strain CCMP1093" /LENGTH=638 /DNA_ID=CAMNT_0025950473 /DNA_START=722 /DNA_END=2638 /DNA_ORIENTATION=+
MRFRVVDKFSFTFETDLPPSTRNIHPSGILHACRNEEEKEEKEGTTETNNNNDEEQHIFAWITSTLHIDLALMYMKNKGYHSDDVIFLPYSTKENWLHRYPAAEPALTVDENGTCTFQKDAKTGGPISLIKKKKNVVSWNTSTKSEEEDLTSSCHVDESRIDTEEVLEEENNKSKKRKRSDKRKKNMLQDNSYLPDLERDELHIEIYNYLRWLHGKLSDLEEKQRNAAAAEELVDAAVAATNNDTNAEEGGKKKNATSLKYKIGVDVSELQCVVHKLESTFAIIYNMKKEEAEAEVAMATAKSAAEVHNNNNEEETPTKQQHQQDNDYNTQDDTAQTTTTTKKEAPPFLEEALSSSLTQLVNARANLPGAHNNADATPKRRSRRWQRTRRTSVGDPRGHDRTPNAFEDMFAKLVRYKEEFGDCLVQKSYSDKKLALWVRNIRQKKRNLKKEGHDYAPMDSGQKMFPSTLTMERVERLNSLGFVWDFDLPPTVPWEDRFRECVEYYEENDRWPSQSMGRLGQWVHRQRQLYSAKDPKYMKERALKLDQVGFEWTPRGNTKMTWDEGFEMLMAFGSINGHYNVQAPAGESVDVKSGEYRLYKWVESLHMMYRSYKMGRQSGSLSEERIMLLVQRGFEFRS